MEDLSECRHIGMLFNPRALKSQYSIKRTQPKNTYATFNGNPYTTIIFCNSLINVSNETDITTFYRRLSSFARHTPKHNVIFIGGDINAQIGRRKW